MVLKIVTFRKGLPPARSVSTFAIKEPSIQFWLQMKSVQSAVAVFNYFLL